MKRSLIATIILSSLLAPVLPAQTVGKVTTSQKQVKKTGPFADYVGNTYSLPGYNWVVKSPTSIVQDDTYEVATVIVSSQKSKNGHTVVVKNWGKETWTLKFSEDRVEQVYAPGKSNVFKLTKKASSEEAQLAEASKDKGGKPAKKLPPPTSGQPNPVLVIYVNDVPYLYKFAGPVHMGETPKGEGQPAEAPSGETTETPVEVSANTPTYDPNNTVFGRRVKKTEE